MNQQTTPKFLFLQGPHGPFFFRLGKMLRAAGCEVWRVGFNAGDQAFWFGAPGYIPFIGKPDVWADTFSALITAHDITDIVLYGDTRPIHKEAIAQAQAAGLRIHVFEEGYMRPYWVTYERGGSNGHSRLMDMSVPDMQQTLAKAETNMTTPPAIWGDMRQHVFYGAAYHWFVLFWNKRYQNFQSHRELPVGKETRLYTRRLFSMPYTAFARRVATTRIRLGGYPYHLALLQLEHDTSFQVHSPFDNMEEFVDIVLDGFAKGAPRHHHLVFKAHPLENGRAPLHQIIRERAERHGIGDRVHFVGGGKLAQLLDHARSAVTINSTAAQQVLWRGIPLKIFGTAVYDKPELVSDQVLPAFFAAPRRPDAKAYQDYRRFLLETSQVPGGFYSTSGRRQLMRQVVDMMLAVDDPYDARKASGRHGARLKVVN